jgi:hypothetical protein
LVSNKTCIASPGDGRVSKFKLSKGRTHEQKIMLVLTLLTAVLLIALTVVIPCSLGTFWGIMQWGTRLLRRATTHDAIF